MARPVKVAALQAPCWTEGKTPRERKAFNAKHVLTLLEEAGRAGADIACAGENSTTHGIEGDRSERSIYEDAETGPTTKKVQRIARKHGMNVVFPICAFHRGALRNMALVMDRKGGIVGAYHKVHPTRREAEHVTAGADLNVFRLDFGTVGAVICHDLSFVESVRVEALKGAEIVFWPNWWSGWGEQADWSQIRARAIDNAIWLVHVSFGQPDGTAWRPGKVHGNSGVIAPDGSTLSAAGRYVGMSLAEIDLDRPRIAHSFSISAEVDFRQAMLADRRPDAYGAMVDRSLVPAAPDAQPPTASRPPRRPIRRRPRKSARQ